MVLRFLIQFFMMSAARASPPLAFTISVMKHPKFCLSADAMYRYALKYATGIGIDVFYSSNMDEIRECDTVLYGEDAVANCEGYSPISLGLAVVQELYWRNLAGYTAVGTYLKNGISGCQERIYQKAGLRYYFPQFGNTMIGFAIKAQNFRAENFEFTVGKKFGN